MTDLEKIEDWVNENKFVDSWSLEAVYIKDLLNFIQSLKPKKENKLDFSGIHSKLEERLLELTGKKQIKGFGGVYFIPTEKELEASFNRYFKDYPKQKDLEKITNCLLNHLENCCKSGNFAPAIKYFIYKDKGSRLANAYENLNNELIIDNSINI